ncbi:unnamed protein product [Moneuplotes crassus]|uniref:Uncharacterized protein n=1 Tax=Euplotes crassus TaxID=5936 RepID=A0AAD1XFN7_EUPCR|nr:unnamed protein product [Moneuplotes crassus]
MSDPTNSPQVTLPFPHLPQGSHPLLKSLKASISQTLHSKSTLHHYNSSHLQSYSIRLHQIHQSLLRTKAEISQTDWAGLTDQIPALSLGIEQVKAEVDQVLEKYNHLFCYGLTKKKRPPKKRCIKTGKKLVPKSTSLALTCSRVLKARENYKKTFTHVENRVYEQTIEIDSQVWAACHENMNSYNFRTGEEGFRPEDRLVIDWEDPSNYKLVKKLQKITLIWLDEVRIINISERHPELAKSILSGLVPRKINHLELRADQFVKIEKFMDGFTCANLKVQIKVTLYNFNIKNQLCLKNKGEKIKDDYWLVKFFQEYKHVKAIKFSECILDFEDISDFSRALKNTSIETLTFGEKYGCYKRCWLGFNGKRFHNFIEGISNSDLKKSLQILCFPQCFEAEQNTVSVLKDNGLDHVEIYSHIRKNCYPQSGYGRLFDYYRDILFQS